MVVGFCFMISSNDDHEGNFYIQEYTCQISAYTPTDLKHSVKIRGEYDDNDADKTNDNEDNEDEMEKKGVSRLSWDGL